MKRIFCVQPYGLKRHKMVAGGAIVFQDREDAVAAGRRLARRRTGVVVVSQDVDPQAGLYKTPEVIAIHGTVPGPWHVAGRGPSERPTV